MIERRSFNQLPAAQHGWLNARFHFVPRHMGGGENQTLGPLIAWNDDEIAGGSGFPLHPHRDMEIVTFVREGTITHEDTLGNLGHAGAGEVQAITAGSGIQHSETNRGRIPVKLFQIWLTPRTLGGQPHWGTTRLPERAAETRFVPLASGDKADVHAIPINANARVSGVRLKAGDRLIHALNGGRHGYLVPTAGRITVNGVALEGRDGCLIMDEPTLTIQADDSTDLVFVELLGSK